MSGGFFRGTSSEQDTRFSNKMAKLLKTQKFAPELELVVDMTKVQMDVMRPWIAARVTELLGFEDEVLINFIYGLLDGKEVDGKHIQIQLTGFMEKNTGRFMKELWSLLTSAQNNISGIPQQFLDAKAEETKKKKAEEQRIFNEIQRKKDQEKALEQEREQKLDLESESLRNSTAVASFSHEPNLEKYSPRGEREKSFDRTPSEANAVSKIRASASMRLSSEPSSCKENGKRARSDSHSTSSLKSSSSPTPSRKGFPVVRGRRHHSRSISITPPRHRASKSPVSRQRSPSNRRLPQRRLRSPPHYRSPARRRRSPSRSPSLPRRRHAPLHSPSPPSRRKYQRSPSPPRRRHFPHSRSPRRRRHSPRRLHSPSNRRFSPLHSRSPPIRRRSPARRVRSSLQSLSPPRDSSAISCSPVRFARSPPLSQSPARRLLSPLRSRSPVKLLPSHLHSRSPERQLRTSVQSHSPVRCLRSTMQSSSPARRLRSSMQPLSPPMHLRSPVQSRSPSRRMHVPAHTPERRLCSPVLAHPSSKNGKSALPLHSPARCIQSPLQTHSPPKHSPSPSHSPYAKLNCSLLHSNSPGKFSDSCLHSQSPLRPSKNKLNPSLHLQSPNQRRSLADSQPPQRIVQLSRPQAPLEDPSPKRELISPIRPCSPTQGLKPSTTHASQRSPSSASAVPSSKMLSRRVEAFNGPFVHSASPPSTDNCHRESPVRIHKSLSREQLVPYEGIEPKEVAGSFLRDRSPGRSEERRETKRRRKEEKRLRKEQRRKKREERRKKREERRAAKAAAKINISVTGWVSPRVQVANESGTSDGDCHAPETMPRTEDEEMESEQKRIENELRKKALESLKARKGISSS